MYKIKLFIILLLVAAFNFNTTAQNSGDNDPTFNPTDIGFGFGVGANGEILTTAIQPDGKIIIGGNFTTYNGTTRNRIARLNTDGSLDTTFNPGSGASHSIQTMVIQSDGKIIIGGYFTNYNGAARNRIARLNTDGSLDMTFFYGTGTNGWIYSIILQSDGKIIIGGDFTTYNGTTRNLIARLNTDGSLDVTFNPGSGANYVIYTTAIQSDGKIIIGGAFTSYNGSARACIARLNTDGSLDATFNPGIGANNVIYTIAIQSDGKIIIGGDFTTYNGASRNRIARLNTDGTLDTTFNSGTGASTLISTATIQSDGKIIVGGNFTTYNGTAKNRIARLNNDGTLDTTFNLGSGASSKIQITAIQPDGKIITGGWFTTYNGIARNYITRLNTDGSLDATFNQGTGGNNSIKTMSIQSDGKIIIGGDFTTFNGTTRNRIARLNTDGSLDTTFNPGSGANYYIYTTDIQSDGKIIIGGWFTSFNGTSINGIARLNTDGSLDTTFNSGTGTNSFIQTTAIQSDGKIIIGGNFTSYSGIARNNIARLNSDGILDTNFTTGTGADNTIWAITIQADGKIIVGGNFTNYNGTSINRIVRLNTDGSLDTTFNPDTGANSWIYTTAIQSDGKIIIGGNFTTFNGTTRNRIARLNTDGSLDTTFNSGSGADEAIFATSLQSDGKIIAGGVFTTYNGTTTNHLAYLNSDGSLDTTFNLGTGANHYIYTTTIQSDGKIIIGGYFTSYNGTGRNRIARILYDTLTGVENVTNHSVFNIYPNPTTAEFIIELASFSPKTQLSIVSVEGKTVYTNNTINTNKIVINTADWSKGIYMVKITDKQSSQVVKLIKQ